MPTEVATRNTVPAELQEKVLLGGDLARLTPAERLSYYNAVCTSVGLNPLTRPFEYLVLNGRMVLYARKDCTDQLRDLHGISIQIVGRELVDGVYVVTAQAQNMTERKDESIGAVPLPASPTDKANAMMKAETKAKRRVTLSICGLGMLDETEIETIPGAKTVQDKPLRLPSEILAASEAKEARPVEHHDKPLESFIGKAPDLVADAPAPSEGDFTLSNAVADWGVTLDDAKNEEELVKIWDMITRDGTLSSGDKGTLYSRYQRLAKGMKRKP